MIDNECLISFMIIFIISENIIVDTKQFDENHRILSRKRRHLVFPEGSSLQLVFCLTTPSVGMGQIFTIGWTAALAWELPSEPYYKYRKQLEAKDRVDKLRNKTSGGWTIKNQPASTSGNGEKDPYRNRIPYTTSRYSTLKDYLKKSALIQMSKTPLMKNQLVHEGNYHRPIYNSSEQWTFWNERDNFARNPLYKEVHRRTRRDLYAKLEKFLSAQRQDGKACILKAICEISKKSSNEVGSFMEEIMKAIFKIDKYKGVDEEDHYDNAANISHNCTELYSGCSASVLNFL